MTLFFLKKELQKSIAEFLLLFITVVYVIYNGVMYAPDSYAFLAQDIDRVPGYTLFLKFFTTLFGDHFEYPVLIAQLFLNVYGIRLLHSYLKQYFGFTKLISFLSLFVLLAPVLYLHFTANKILSEALCYPLYLIFIANTLKGYLEKHKKNIYYALGILLLLILIRSQFLFLIPVLVLVSGYFFYKTRDKVHLIFILISFLIPFLVNMMDKGYHCVVHGYFVSTPGTGHTLTTSVFYLADKEDYNLFDSDVERNYFKKIKEKLDVNQWSNDHASRYDSIQMFALYQVNYPNICNETIHGIGLEYHKEIGMSKNEQYIATSDLALKMYKPLLFDNLKKWIKLYVFNIKASLGTTKNLLLHIFVLIVGLILIVQNNSQLGKAITFMLLCTLANIALLAVATHSIKRYTFYNDWVIFLVVFIFINEYIKKQSKPVSSNPVN